MAKVDQELAVCSVTTASRQRESEDCANQPRGERGLAAPFDGEEASTTGEGEAWVCGWVTGRGSGWKIGSGSPCSFLLSGS